MNSSEYDPLKFSKRKYAAISRYYLTALLSYFGIFVVYLVYLPQVIFSIYIEEFEGTVKYFGEFGFKVKAISSFPPPLNLASVDCRPRQCMYSVDARQRRKNTSQTSVDSPSKYVDSKSENRAKKENCVDTSGEMSTAVRQSQSLSLPQLTQANSCLVTRGRSHIFSLFPEVDCPEVVGREKDYAIGQNDHVSIDNDGDNCTGNGKAGADDFPLTPTAQLQILRFFEGALSDSDGKKSSVMLASAVRSANITPGSPPQLTSDIRNHTELQNDRSETLCLAIARSSSSSTGSDQTSADDCAARAAGCLSRHAAEAEVNGDNGGVVTPVEFDSDRFTALLKRCHLATAQFNDCQELESESGESHRKPARLGDDVRTTPWTSAKSPQDEIYEEFQDLSRSTPDTVNLYASDDSLRSSAEGAFQQSTYYPVLSALSQASFSGNPDSPIVTCVGGESLHGGKSMEGADMLISECASEVNGKCGCDTDPAVYPPSAYTSPVRPSHIVAVIGDAHERRKSVLMSNLCRVAKARERQLLHTPIRRPGTTTPRCYSGRKNATPPSTPASGRAAETTQSGNRSGTLGRRERRWNRANDQMPSVCKQQWASETGPWR